MLKIRHNKRCALPMRREYHMFKQWLLKLFAIWILLPTFVGMAHANPMQIVVTEHGIVGDGRTDVTAALQKLVSATFNTPYSRQENMPGKYHVASYPEVVFPQGVYILTDMIVWPNYVRVRGEGQVIIRQTNSDADIFYIHWANQVWIEGLTFEGGRKSLKFWTHNIDQVVLHVNHCTFRNSSSYAIENTIQNTQGSTRNAQYEGQKFRGLYLKDKTTSDWLYLDEPDAPYTHNSTLMVISNSRFENCSQVLHSNVDWGVMQHCEIQMSGPVQQAAINNHGMLRISDTHGRWNAGDGLGAWVDHYSGQLYLQRVDFAGNGPAVRNYAEIRSGFGGIHYALVASDSCFGTVKATAAVFDLLEFPNLLSVENCQATTQSLRLLNLDDKADHSKLPSSGPSQQVAVVLAGNRGFQDDVPAVFLPVLQQPVNVAMDVNLLAMATSDWHDPQGVSTQPVYIDVTDLGAVRNDRKDDLQAFQKAFTAAALQQESIVVLPAGFYELSDAVHANGRVHVQAIGHAVVRAMDDTQPLFVIDDATDVRVGSLTMIGGRAGWLIQASRTTPQPWVHFDHCEFNRTRGIGVSCVEGDGKANASPQTKLWLNNCLFSHAKSAVSSNVQTLLEDSWISSQDVGEDGFADFAFVVNRGWMICRNVLGVPVIHDQTVDSRWIDNMGKLWCDYFRFGGEYGGVTNVNIVPAPGVRNVTWIEHSWLYALRNVHRRTRIDVASEPSQIMLRNNTAVEDMGPNPVPTVMLRQALRGNPGWFAAYGNTFNKTIKVVKDNP